MIFLISELTAKERILLLFRHTKNGNKKAYFEGVIPYTKLLGYLGR